MRVGSFGSARCVTARPHLGLGCQRAVLRPGYLERRGIADIACGLCVRRNLGNATEREGLVKRTKRSQKGFVGKKNTFLLEPT